MESSDLLWLTTFETNLEEFDLPKVDLGVGGIFLGVLVLFKAATSFIG